MIQPLHIPIKPRPAPRPRFGRDKRGNVRTYNHSWYTKYKEALTLTIKSANIPKKDYSKLYVTIGIPYPKHIKGGQKAKIEALPHRKASGDTDNFVKGIKDAIEQAGVLTNDCQIYYEVVCKVWTKTDGYIEFFLK